MWRRRTQSSLRDKLDLGFGYHFLTEVAAEKSLGPQVDVASDDLAQLVLHADHVDEGDLGLRCELHQHVHVALRTKVGAQDGPEEGEAPDGIAAAKRGDALVIDGDVEAQTAPPFSDRPVLALRVYRRRPVNGGLAMDRTLTMSSGSRKVLLDGSPRARSANR